MSALSQARSDLGIIFYLAYIDGLALHSIFVVLDPVQIVMKRVN